LYKSLNRAFKVLKSLNIGLLMANPVLFQSSVFLGLIHILIVMALNADPWISLIYSIGAFTSVWNHGSTMDVAKWLDRLCMCIGTVTDIFYIWKLPFWLSIFGYSFVIIYIGCYFISKKLINGNIPHIITHIGATLCHIWLLWYLFKNTITKRKELFKKYFKSHRRFRGGGG